MRKRNPYAGSYKKIISIPKTIYNYLAAWGKTPPKHTPLYYPLKSFLARPESIRDYAETSGIPRQIRAFMEGLLSDFGNTTVLKGSDPHRLLQLLAPHFKCLNLSADTIKVMDRPHPESAIHAEGKRTSLKEEEEESPSPKKETQEGPFPAHLSGLIRAISGADEMATDLAVIKTAHDEITSLLSEPDLPDEHMQMAIIMRLLELADKISATIAAAEKQPSRYDLAVFKTMGILFDDYQQNLIQFLTPRLREEKQATSQPLHPLPDLTDSETSAERLERHIWQIYCAFPAQNFETILLDSLKKIAKVKKASVDDPALNVLVNLFFRPLLSQQIKTKYESTFEKFFGEEAATYMSRLGKPGTWSGAEEFFLVSHLLHRPVVIYEKDPKGGYTPLKKLGVFGEQYKDNPPIRLWITSANKPTEPEEKNHFHLLLPSSKTTEPAAFKETPLPDNCPVILLPATGDCALTGIVLAELLPVLEDDSLFIKHLALLMADKPEMWLEIDPAGRQMVIRGNIAHHLPQPLLSPEDKIPLVPEPMPQTSEEEWICLPEDNALRKVILNQQESEEFKTIRANLINKEDQEWVLMTLIFTLDCDCELYLPYIKSYPEDKVGLKALRETICRKLEENPADLGFPGDITGLKKQYQALFTADESNMEKVFYLGQYVEERIRLLLKKQKSVFQGFTIQSKIILILEEFPSDKELPVQNCFQVLKSVRRLEKLTEKEEVGNELFYLCRCLLKSLLDNLKSDIEGDNIKLTRYETELKEVLVNLHTDILWDTVNFPPSKFAETDIKMIMDFISYFEKSTKEREKAPDTVIFFIAPYLIEMNRLPILEKKLAEIGMTSESGGVGIVDDEISYALKQKRNKTVLELFQCIESSLPWERIIFAMLHLAWQNYLAHEFKEEQVPVTHKKKKKRNKQQLSSQKQVSEFNQYRNILVTFLQQADLNGLITLTSEWKAHGRAIQPAILKTILAKAVLTQLPRLCRWKISPEDRSCVTFLTGLIARISWYTLPFVELNNDDKEALLAWYKNGEVTDVHRLSAICLKIGLNELKAKKEKSEKKEKPAVPLPPMTEILSPGALKELPVRDILGLIRFLDTLKDVDITEIPAALTRRMRYMAFTGYLKTSGIQKDLSDDLLSLYDRLFQWLPDNAVSAINDITSGQKGKAPIHQIEEICCLLFTAFETKIHHAIQKKKDKTNEDYTLELALRALLQAELISDLPVPRMIGVIKKLEAISPWEMQPSLIKDVYRIWRDEEMEQLARESGQKETLNDVLELIRLFPDDLIPVNRRINLIGLLKHARKEKNAPYFVEATLKLLKEWIEKIPNTQIALWEEVRSLCGKATSADKLLRCIIMAEDMDAASRNLKHWIDTFKNEDTEKKTRSSQKQSRTTVPYHLFKTSQLMHELVFNLKKLASADITGEISDTLTHISRLITEKGGFKAALKGSLLSPETISLLSDVDLSTHPLLAEIACKDTEADILRKAGVDMTRWKTLQIRVSFYLKLQQLIECCRKKITGDAFEKEPKGLRDLETLKAALDTVLKSVEEKIHRLKKTTAENMLKKLLTQAISLPMEAVPQVIEKELENQLRASLTALKDKVSLANTSLNQALANPVNRDTILTLLGFRADMLIIPKESLAQALVFVCSMGMSYDERAYMSFIDTRGQEYRIYECKHSAISGGQPGQKRLFIGKTENNNRFCLIYYDDNPKHDHVKYELEIFTSLRNYMKSNPEIKIASIKRKQTNQIYDWNDKSAKFIARKAH